MRNGRSTLAVLVGCTLGACAPEASEPEQSFAPVVASLSTDAVSVGEPIELRGSDFLSPEDGWVDVTFRGEFQADDGSPPESVEVTVPLAPTEGVLLWRQFGGYRVPFGPGDQIGEFNGHVFATNRYFNGSSVTQDEDTWKAFRIKVLPSVIVTDFRAVGDSWVADCIEPARNVIQWLPYAMRVQAIGFDPAQYEFLLSGGLWQNEVSKDGRWLGGRATVNQTHIRHATTKHEHAVLMQLAPVPEGLTGFRMQVEVVVQDERGSSHRLTYPFMVRRPVETFFTTGLLEAQRYPAESVSGCLDGSEVSSNVEYRETKSVTRTRTQERGIQRAWTATHGAEYQESYGVEKSRLHARTASREVAVSDARTAGYQLGVSEMFAREQGRQRAHSIDFDSSGSQTIGWNVAGERSSQYSGELGTEYGDRLGEELRVEPQLLGQRLGGIGYVTESYLNKQARSGYIDRRGTEGGVEGSATYARTTREGWRDGASLSEQESFGRQRGWHWDFTHTYTESNSFSQTETWGESRSFDAALSRSETMGSELAISDSQWESVSSEHHISIAIMNHFPAKRKGMWFRQATRKVMVGKIVAYDLCGNGSDVGSVRLNDWEWAASFSMTDSGDCNQLEPRLKAECILEPCD